jgi:hypothetical protein
MSTISNTNLVLLAATLITLGLLVHDTKICSAAEAANMAPKAKIASTHKDPSDSKLLHINLHVHTASTTLLNGNYNMSSQTPAAQPRGDGEKKYLANKRIVGNSHDNDYIQPI